MQVEQPVPAILQVEQSVLAVLQVVATQHGAGEVFADTQLDEAF